MPKIIPIALQEHLKNESKVTTLCTIIKIIRKDGFRVGLTNLDRDLILEDDKELVYSSNASFDDFAISNSNRNNVDNVDFKGLISHPLITVEDIRTGRYDDAIVTIATINYKGELLSENIDIIVDGTLGNIQLLNKSQYTCEIRGLNQYSQQTQKTICQASCRSRFLDRRCVGVDRGPGILSLNINDYSFTSTILQIINQKELIVNFEQPTDFFKYGELHFLSGKNKGMIYEIKEWDKSINKITLELACQYPIEINDEIKAIAGCNKTIDRCADFFQNAINFQGEPFVPLKSDVINYMS